MIKYWRYSATGNTFLLFDAREINLNEKMNKIFLADLCGKFDVDGVIFLEVSEKYDFHMRYLNADGAEVEMCGNGARSITHFASVELGIIPMSSKSYTFSTHSGVYQSIPIKDYPVLMTELKDLQAIDIGDLYKSSFSMYLNTGVPHCVFEVGDPIVIDLISVAKPIRFNERFANGTNVNFFSHDGARVVMRTFERGVEDETLSCGTGAVAVAVSLFKYKSIKGPFNIKAPGGELIISCSKDLEEIWLAGPVTLTEKGEITV